MFPKLMLGDVEEHDGRVAVLPTMGQLHGEVEKRDTLNQIFELRTFFIGVWIGWFSR